MKKLLTLLVCFLLAQPVLAQSVMPPAGHYPVGGGGGGGGADVDATYLQLTGSGTNNNERIFTLNSPLSAVDSGAGGAYTVSLGTVLVGKGGLGGTTYQASGNNLFDGIGGPAAANGDILYRTGGNWNRLPIGTPGQVLTVDTGLPAWSSASVSAPATAQYVTLAVDGTLSDERVLAGTANKITITDGGAGGNVTLNVGTDVVTLTDTQTLTNKTLTSPKLTYSATDGLLLRNSIASADGKIVWADFPGNRTLTIPDPGGAASFVMTEGAATINGAKTFSNLILSGTTLTAGGNTMTFPGSTQTLAGLTATQTLTNKELTAPSFTASSLTLKQSTANYTIGWDNPAAGRAYSITDVNGDAQFAMKDTTTYTNGGLAYGDGNLLRVMASAGTSGQALVSAGSGSPMWGTLGAAGGGTGQSSYTAGDILRATGATTLSKLNIGTASQVLGVNTGATDLEYKTITAGSGITVTPSAGAITIASTATGTVTSVAQSLSGLGFMAVSGSPVTSSGTLTLTASGTTGDTLYFSGASTISKLGIGSSGQVLKVSGGLPTWGTDNTGGFGGDGSAGAVTKATTSDTITQINATTFSQSASNTWTADSGIVINCTSTATFSGTTTVGNLGNGMTAAPEATSDTGARGAIRNIGSYGGGGVSSTVGATYGGGGGGGGFGGAGGRGGNDGNAIVTGGLAGTAAPVNEFGTGGAGGSGGWGSAAGGAGGSKGGNLRVCAVGAISFANGCTVSTNGSAGSNGSGTGSGGGGGGAGGYQGHYSQTSITYNTGSAVNANGGNGGSGSDSNGGKGGGGGGGRIIAMSPSNTVTVSPTMTGGSLGGTGVATNAAAGSSNTLNNITGTPNLPLIAHMERSAGLSVLENVAWFKNGQQLPTGLMLTHEQVAQVEAAICAKPGQFGNMFLTLMNGGKNKEQLSQMSAINLEDNRGLPVGEIPWQEYGITQTVMIDDAVGGRT